MVVIISSLDEVYVKLFDKIAFHLRAILPKRQIHHVGSTAVPGLAGKNIVDVLVSARNIHDIAAIKRRLQKAGFFLGHIATLRMATYLWRHGAKKQSQATFIFTLQLRARRAMTIFCCCAIICAPTLKKLKRTPQQNL